MTVGEDIYTTLSTDTYVTGIVNTRIYPNFIKKGATYPAVSYFLVNAVPQLMMDCTYPITQYSYQFDCWAKTYSEVVDLSNVVIAALNDATLFKTIHTNTQDFFDPEFETYRLSIDYSIWQ